MAKKVVAALKKGDAKGYSKVIKMVKSKKTGNYSFKEDIIPTEMSKEFFDKK